MAFPKANPNQLIFVDSHTGIIKRYIQREGLHPKTGKPLSDILVFADNKAVNWPKIVDKETGEVRPWDYFSPDLVLDEGVKVDCGWSEQQFHCTAAK